MLWEVIKGDNMTSNDLEKIVDEIGIEKAEQYIESLKKKSLFPRLGWAVQPLAIKVMLKMLEEKERTPDQIKNNLQILGLIGSDENDYNTNGLIKWNWGLWTIENKKIQLTKTGSEIAEMFNKDFSILSIAEKAIILGMVHGSGEHAFLHIMYNRKDWEISRKDLLREMNKIVTKKRETGHKGKLGDFYSGYCKTMFERLGILESFKRNGETYYRLKVA